MWDTLLNPAILSTFCLFKPIHYLFLRLRPNRHTRLWGTVPHLGEGVELGVGLGTPWKPYILGTICLLEPKNSISVHLRSNRHACFVRSVPHFGKRLTVELGVRCGTPWKSFLLGAICLLKPRLYLSPLMCQSQFKFCLRVRPPQFAGRGGVGVDCDTPCKPITMCIICLLKAIRYLASFRGKTPCKFWCWGCDPKLGGRGGARGTKMVSFESVLLVSY